MIAKRHIPRAGASAGTCTSKRYLRGTLRGCIATVRRSTRTRTAGSFLPAAALRTPRSPFSFKRQSGGGDGEFVGHRRVVADLEHFAQHVAGLGPELEARRAHEAREGDNVRCDEERGEGQRRGEATAPERRCRIPGRTQCLAPRYVRVEEDAEVEEVRWSSAAVIFHRDRTASGAVSRRTSGADGRGTLPRVGSTRCASRWASAGPSRAAAP